MNEREKENDRGGHIISSCRNSPSASTRHLVPLHVDSEEAARIAAPILRLRLDFLELQGHSFAVSLKRRGCNGALTHRHSSPQADADASAIFIPPHKWKSQISDTFLLQNSTIRLNSQFYPPY